MDKSKVKPKTFGTCARTGCKNKVTRMQSRYCSNTCYRMTGKHTDAHSDIFKRSTLARSRYWPDMVEILENNFPKGRSRERGQALVMLAYIEMLLQGTRFSRGVPVPKDENNS